MLAGQIFDQPATFLQSPVVERLLCSVAQGINILRCDEDVVSPYVHSNRRQRELWLRRKNDLELPGRARQRLGRTVVILFGE